MRTPRHRRAALVGSLLLGLVAPRLTVAAPTSTQSLPYRRAVELPEAPPTGLAVVTLDAPLLRETDNSYNNLRLMRADGQETPFQVRPRRGVRTTGREFVLPHRQERVQVLDDNRLEIILHHTNRYTAPVALLIETKLDNFEKQVAVWAGDGEHWEPLVEAQPIFDYSRFINARHLRVELPPTAHTHLRVLIAEISAAERSPFTQFEQERRQGATVSEVERQSFQRLDFRIDGLLLMACQSVTQPDALVKQPYPLGPLTTTHDPERRETKLRFSAGRAPLTELDLQTPTPFFHRTVTIEGSDSPERGWIRLGSATLSRLQAGTAHVDETRIPLPRAVRYHEYRLIIEDLDSPPLAITGITALGEVHELVFFHEPPAAYTLFYGGDQIPAPRYDVARALADAPTTGAAVFTLGPDTPNPAFSPGGTPGRLWWNQRGMLAAAVFLMVAVLGWVLARAARHIPPPAA